MTPAGTASYDGHDDDRHDAMRDLVAAHALDAVDADERALVEEHLASCPACRREHEDVREAAAELAGLTPVPPPTGLRTRLLDAIAVTPQLPAEGAARAGHVAPGESAESVETAESAKSAGHVKPAGSAASTPAAHAGNESDPASTGHVRPTETRRTPPPGRGPRLSSTGPGRRPRRRAVLLGLAGLGAAAVVGGGLAITRPWMSATDRRIEQVLEASDAHRFDATMGDTRVQVVRSPENRAAVLLSDDMAAAPAGHDYQMWYLEPDGAVASAGLLRPAEDGRVRMLLDGDAASAGGAALSVEPEGGSAQPTTEPALVIEFA